LRHIGDIVIWEGNYKSDIFNIGLWWPFLEKISFFLEKTPKKHIKPEVCVPGDRVLEQALVVKFTLHGGAVYSISDRVISTDRAIR
jgi:hypothetical protein